MTEQNKQKKERKARRTYTDEERKAFQNELKTGGRKGCALPRINMAFAQDIYDYVRIMSSASGQTMTQFVDLILRKSMTDNAELYEQAKALNDSLKSRGLTREGE